MVVADYVKRNLGKNKVIVLVDYENAFNSIHRSTFLAATRKYLPTISPWIEWCYGRPTSLLHGRRPHPVATRGHSRVTRQDRFFSP